jgi:hypothetical protein
MGPVRAFLEETMAQTVPEETEQTEETGLGKGL